MKIHPTVKSLFLILLVTTFLFLISYSTFLQIPVVVDEALVWQSLVEQAISWIPFVLSFAILYKQITKQEKEDAIGLNESRLLIPSVIFVFLMGMSIGVHSTSQIIEDALISQKTSFVYRLAFFLDEQIGHLFLIPGAFLSIIFCALELNRKCSKLTALDKWLTNLSAVLTAAVAVILIVEAGVIYIIGFPAIAFSYYFLVKFARNNKVNLSAYPFNRYLIIVGLLITLFSLLWLAINRFSQPEELGLHLFGI